MKIAIIHEMLIKLGGAEKVVESLLRIYPEADLFTLIYDEKKCGKDFPKEKINKQVFSLPTQKIYDLTKKQRFCLPKMAKSVEQLDFSQYDVVLCSSSGFAHGAITKPETKFIVYYHAPARYMWDWTNEYKRDLGLNSGWKKYILAPYINHTFYKNRQWDYIASNRVDISLANAKNTQNRIRKYYKKESEVLYPPVETNRFGKELPKKEQTPPNLPLSKGGNSKKVPLLTKEGLGEVKNYYIIISALTEFKRIDVAIKGFNNLEENLVIIGRGEYKDTLEKMITGKNIQFVGAQYGDDLVSLVQNSSGLIFPGEEDFGIVPIEVMAAGKPVFAYNGWGLTETVLAGITGDFFDDSEGSDFVEKFHIFHKNNLKGKYKWENCKKQAETFSEAAFAKRIRELVEGE